MTDPRRWLDDPDALDETELGVLSAGRGATPPARLRRAVWGALAARLPIAETAAATAGSSVAKVGAASLVKALAVGVAAGAVVIGGVTLSSAPPSPTIAGSRAPATGTSSRPLREASLPPAEAPVVGSAQPTALEVPTATPMPALKRARRLEGVDEVEPASLPSTVATFPIEPAPAAQGASASTSGAVNEESRLIAGARKSLRSGNVEEAQGALERARALFPNGVLVQEREALAIETLAASGERALARTRALAFLRAYPNSPYGARVRAVAGIETP